MRIFNRVEFFLFILILHIDPQQFVFHCNYVGEMVSERLKHTENAWFD